jgi:putative polyhydroxyalkanoate system protein
MRGKSNMTATIARTEPSKPRLDASHSAIRPGPQYESRRLDRGRDMRRIRPRILQAAQGGPMSGIDIRHSHSLPQAKARKALEELAKKLAERFDIEYEWDGDDLLFNRAGVDGKIALAPKQVHVTAKLGFLVSAFKGSIEQEIRRVLDERFS